MAFADGGGRLRSGASLDDVLAEFGALAERVSRELRGELGRGGASDALADALERTRRLAAGLRSIGSMTHGSMRVGGALGVRPSAPSDEMHELARAVAHELRSPLHALGLSLHVLKRQREADPHVLEPLAELEATLDRARELIRSIHDLTLGEVARASERVAWLGPALARVVDDLADEARTAGVEVRLEPEVPHVLVEAILLHLVVANVAGNSIKYHDPAKPRRWVRVSARLDRGRCELAVADNGLGIQPEHLPRVTQRGFRGRPGHARGSGLGLHIVERALASRGGSLALASTVSEGTTVTVRMPYTIAARLGPAIGA